MNAILITVRTNSSRLPNKCLLEINGKKILDLVIERAKLSKKNNKIIVCTTTDDSDDIIEMVSKEHNILCYRGSVKDKLVRWYQACLKYEINNIVTFDADDPLCSPELIDLAFEELESSRVDFIGNDNLVCGSFSFAFNFESLKKVVESKNNDDTEMMWPYFINNKSFVCSNLKPDNERYFEKGIRLTLDYSESCPYHPSLH